MFAIPIANSRPIASDRSRPSWKYTDRRSPRMVACGKRAISRGQILGRAERGAGRHDPVGEPHLVRLGGGHRPPGNDHVKCPAHPDQPRQPHGAAVDQRHAPATAEDTEDRVLLDDPQVTPAGEFESPGHRVAGDGGDHRLGHPHPGRAHRTVAAVPQPIAALLVAERGQIGTGAERAAGAGQHRDARVVVGVELPNASTSAAAVGPSTALRTSGRSSNTVVTGPSTETRTPLMATTLRRRVDPPTGCSA